MNQEIFFWNRWLPAYRRLYVGLLIITGIALVGYLVQKYIGADAVINWQVFNELQDIEFATDQFSRGIFNFTTEAQSFVVAEWFEASDMQVNFRAAYWYGGLLMVALTFVLAVVTNLPRWWYLGSMMVFIGLLAAFQLDILQVWGLPNSTVLLVSLAVFLSVSYYLHAFRPDISFPKRLIIFGFLVAAAVFVWLRFAQVAHPALGLLAYGTRVLALLTILFIFIIAHEIPSHLLTFITGTGIAAGRNSIFHFTVISVFYVGNLMVSYLHNSGILELNFLYVNGFYLLAVSVVLGIWGFRRRVDPVFSDPYASLLYAALVIIALGTIGYAFATGNDPMLDMFEDVIVYSHLATGLSFFLYVYINFRGPMSQGLPVHKIMYQPRIFPFGFSYALAGLIMLALLFRVNMLPFNQGVAGYQNQLGDLYFAEQNFILAESYYKKALLFNTRNHKSNYALATIAKQHNNPEAMAAFLKQAITNKPTPHTYAMLSQLYAQEDLFFDAVFTLREGTRKFPESGELFNNLGVLYEKTRILDSAYVFYSQALDLTGKPEVVRSNLLAFWAKNFSGRKLDSVLAASEPNNYLSYENNRLVISNLLQKPDSQVFSEAMMQDTLLNRERFAYLYNYTLNHKKQADTNLLRTINRYATQPDNSLFSADLNFAKAVNLYHTNNVGLAFETLKDLEQGSAQRSAYFNKMLGMWYLKQNVPRLAAYRFGKSVQAGDSLGVLNETFAWMENSDFQTSSRRWDSLRASPVAQLRGVANSMFKITQTLLGNAADSLSDAEKTALVYYSRREDTSPIVASIQDMSYRASALLYLARNHLEKDNISSAESNLRQLQTLAVSDAETKKAVHELESEIFWRKKDWPALAAALKTPGLSRKSFYQAVLADNADKTAEAEKYYLAALQNLPFDETVVLAAQQFYNRRRNDERAYQTLTDALRVNPLAAGIRKAYVMQCLDMNLTEYAAQGMDELRLNSPADHQAFAPQYKAKLALVEKKLAEWK